MVTFSALRRLDARIPLVALLIAGLCAVFWLDSRYPSLQGKAGADPREALATPLGFERHWPEPPADQTVKHIAWTAAEWAITNKQGMTFGVLLAAGLLTLIPLLPAPRGGRLTRALQGVLVGAPLGVCVNCAAPIGQAMLRGGARTETALAAMFTSPSFNVIVLGMLLTLFPWHLVLLKIASVLILVLGVVPLLSALAERHGWRHAELAPASTLPGLRLFQWLESAFSRASARMLVPDRERPRGFFGALGWVLLHYPRNLWTVIRLSVPLMLLAGLIGAVLTELLPWHELGQMARVEGLAANAGVLVLAAAFGTLLPVPIAFDIVLCSVLWTAGFPPYLVACLLVTLGIYSVYPWTLLGTTLSWRIASLAGLAVFLLGLAAGAAADLLDRWHDIRLDRAASSYLEAVPHAEPAPRLPAGRSAEELAGTAPALPRMQRVLERNGVVLSGAPFQPALGTGPGEFVRIDGPALGLERIPLRRAYLAMQPGVMELGGLAAGDVDADGWPDLAIGTPFGVWLYRNLGGRFALQAIDFPAMRDWITGEVALVDLDGDGALDLYFGTWMHGSHVLFNRGGSFSAAAHTELPRHAETAVHSAAFADVDRDGDLDLVTGASTFGMWNFHPVPAVNRLWRNDGRGRFTDAALEGPEGETLALLLRDFDGDGWPDLLVGNDFDEPDRYYHNDRGRLVARDAAGSPLPYTTTTTMSLDTGDLDNDGTPELYFGQIALGNPGGDLARRLAPPVTSCAINDDVADRSRCDALARFQAAVTRARDTESLAPCEALDAPAERRDCVVTAYLWNRVLVKLPSLRADAARVRHECARVPPDYAAMRAVCEAIAGSPLDYGQGLPEHEGLLPSQPRFNLLFSLPADGAARDVTRHWGVGFGGWTWNSKFGDLDNDGWQDLFVAQGTRLRLSNVYSLYYRNENGQRLADRTREAGLQDHRPTGASLQLDVDMDGDLDLVTYPFLLTPTVWRNDSPRGAGFELALRDLRGTNREAIGARVEIRAADGRRQWREIKGSGGYQSHDLAVARFGLGAWPSVAALRVTWPDSTATELDGLALEGGRYTLTRR